MPGPSLSFIKPLPVAGSALLLSLALLLGGCSGGSGSSTGDGAATTKAVPESSLAGPVASTATLTGGLLPADQRATTIDVARFLSQASFGPVSTDEIAAVQAHGYQAWLNHQFQLPAASQLDYLVARTTDAGSGQPTEEMSYEAIWQQWLFSEGQLRARVAFALSEIFVVSNIAPDLNPLAMSSWMDMLNRNAFGNYRQLLEDVTLHPAMGYYLNMLESEKEDPQAGTHPNENYAREVLQLFSIGLVKLDTQGRVLTGNDGKPLPTYDQSVVQGFAKAFTGWGFGGRNTTSNDSFHDGDPDWVRPMQAWPARHSTGAKLLLDGQSLPAGQSPQADLKGALDAIFNHPNVGPFIARRLIQRLVTSNPGPAYIGRVAGAFNNNGAGVRGDLRAVVAAVLLDPEARDLSLAQGDGAGKQREPVIRFANLLRGLRASSVSGHNDIHYLDSADNALGQSPLLAPSVFNFFSPDFRNPGPIAQRQLYSPEFQITNETTVVGSLNFFSWVLYDGGYGSDDNRLRLDYSAMESVSADPQALVNFVDLMFMNGMADPATRSIISQTVAAIPAGQKRERVVAALMLTMISPDFVIQR